MQQLNEISQQITATEKKITSNVALTATFKLFRLKIEQRQHEDSSYLQSFDEISQQMTVIEKKIYSNVVSITTSELNAFDVLIEATVLFSLNNI